MNDYTIFPYDCVDAMHHLIDEGSVHCCVTSPPYFKQRDYKHAGQIGLEQSPTAYIARIVEMARAVRRVLRDDGVFWLNLGDTYASRSTYNAPQSMATANGWKQAGRGPNTGGVPQGYQDKDLLGIPWRVAFALQDDGWCLRQEIIWSKPNVMPESVKDRCTRAHEYIFMFTKGPRYFYDAEAIKETAVSANAAKWTDRSGSQKPRGAALADGHYSRRTVGSPQFMPPGETLVLVTGDGLALFGWWRPHPSSGIKAMNGLDGWTCTIFRNVGPHLSSTLILDAELWLYGIDSAPCGPDGLITHVWDKKVATDAQPGRAAGWCFRKAGYRATGRSADGKKTLLQKPWP